MFRYNPKAKYEPNGGRYLQILSGKDLYKQTIVIGSKDTFPARFPNIFVDYPLGQMHVGDRVWTNWNKAPIRLANTVEFCSVVHIQCLWGQFCAFKLYQAPYD